MKEQQVFNFQQQKEIELFSKRNQKLLWQLDSLNDALDHVFSHTPIADKEHITIFMLGRRCANDFAEICLLGSNGFGFAAMMILRSMFEKLVDATYLHLNPTEIDSFWDYNFVALKKLGFEDIAKERDSDWEKKVNSFRGNSGRLQPRWTKADLVSVAKKVGLEKYLRQAYYVPNSFIHSSVEEIYMCLKKEEDDSITLIDFENETERSFADIALGYSWALIIRVMKLEIEHYNWTDSEAVFQKCFDSYMEYVKPT